MRNAIGIVVAVGLLAVIAFVFYAIFEMSRTSPAAIGQRRILQRLLDRVPPPPHALVLRRFDVSRASIASVGESIDANSGQNVVYLYYWTKLQRLGWKQCGAPADPNAIPDQNYFVKPPYEAVLAFQPDAPQRYDFQLEWQAKPLAAPGRCS